MARPTRPAPAPPPPEHCRSQLHHLGQINNCQCCKCHSLSRSYYVLPTRTCCGGGGSECGADSVHSMPLVALTSPSHSIRSPTYCKSESARSSYCQSSCCCSHNTLNHQSQCYETSSVYSFHSACSQPRSSCHGSGYGFVDMPAHVAINNPVHNQNYHRNHMNTTPTTINSEASAYNCSRTNDNNLNTTTITNNNINICNNNNNHIQEESKPRQLLTYSPMPIVKNTLSTQGERKSRVECNSFHYRRHIEQHVERIFKYLEERESRRVAVEKENSNDRNMQTIIDLLAIKESRHLRSLRKKLGPDDFEIISGIGRGYMGEVCLVRKKSCLDGPPVFAMKQLKKTQVFQQNHIAHIMAERDILAEADNEWIVKLYYSFQDKNNLYFILEYVPGGDLMNLLSLKNVFPEDWARFYIAEISLAVQFVHDMNFIHRDIKPDNILIDKEGHIKLTDFGLCTGFRWTHNSKYYRDQTMSPMYNNNNNSNVDSNVDDYNQDDDSDQDEHGTITNKLTLRHKRHELKKKNLSLVGSPNYIAPEVLRQAFNIQESTDERLCDWWSVGVILYEMVIGYCPFIDLEALKMGKYSPSLDHPQYIQRRIVDWKNHLKFPDMNDPNSPPLMLEVKNPCVPTKSNDKPIQYAKPKYIELETEQLIRGLLSDPKDRLNGLCEIKCQPFFFGTNWDTIRQEKAPYIPEVDNVEDTSHFPEQFNMTNIDPENQSGLTLRTRVNDFTYKNFWNKE